MSLAVPKGWSLVKFDEGRDQVFVNASVSVGYDSNIFARKGGDGDVLTTSSFGIEYARHAGYIAINASATWNLGQFNSNTDQNFSNPTLNLELVKSSGRTTGSFTLSAARQSSADTAINARTDSWNYAAGLNLKYPVIDRYSISGGLNYGLTAYQQAAPGIYNLTTYGANADLFYAYTSERDLIAGYAIQFSDSGANTQTTDHIFTVGISGKILPKVNGSIRGGYEIRQEDATGQSFGTWNASASATWSLNRRISFTGTLKKSFSTTATDASIDTLSANIDMQYSLTAKWSLFSGIGGGESEFISGASTGRQDYYFTWSAGVNYSLNEHFKASLTYSFFKNWSSQSLGNYARDSISLTLSTRW
ncbi:MAG TPA: outer membrane beta-barrel protein [Rariglobus sp.]|nr:outer membrane beta-barrel protein [Rariglobus sp.]